MESVIWAFKQLYDKGWVYEGFRVLPYCWNDETPLSNHELRMDDDVYQMRQDPAVTVGLPDHHRRAAARRPAADLDDDAVDAAEQPRGDGRRRTSTTSWSAHDGAARATCSPRRGSRRTRASWATDVPDVVWRGHRRRPGRAAPTRRRSPTTPATRTPSASCRRTRPSPPPTAPGWCTAPAPSVRSTRSVTDREGIEAVMPVGKDGQVHRTRSTTTPACWSSTPTCTSSTTSRPPRRAGQTGSVTPGTVLLRRETYDHSYPHCWRCREPLIYKGVSSWFVEVTAIKQRMLELNQQINWVPEHIKDGQFGKWLENARDWSITRNRFWGSPVPVWKSDDAAYPRHRRLRLLRGDRARLRPAAARTATASPTCTGPTSTTWCAPTRTTRPASRRCAASPTCSTCGSTPGSMSFAQVHCPFENERLVRAPLPGRLHRRVHRPDPRLVLHAAHPGHRRSSTGRRSRTASATASCSAPTATRCRSRCATTPTSRGLRPRRRRRDALVPDVVADPARRQPGRHRAGHPRRGAAA